MDLDELDDLYRDAILDHCRNPRRPDPLEDTDITADGVNPFCGDEVHIQIGLDEDGRVARIGLQGVGCAINQASGSMLAEVAEGKSLDEIGGASEAFHRMMRGDSESVDAVKSLGDLHALSGVRRFPVRIKCALLAWSSLEDGIAEYRQAGPA